MNSIEAKIRVLVIDDEPANTMIIGEILDFEGEYFCRLESNGESGLACLDEFRPDIILLDILMPGIDGYEVCRQIRSNPSHKFIKIIIVSAKTDDLDRLSGYEAGADDFVTKPFVEEELLAKVRVFARLKKTEEVDLLKNSMLSLFSHESRTPLNGILMGAELLTKSSVMPEQEKEFAMMVYDSGKRLQKLVEQVLFLSELKSQTIPLEETDISLCSLLSGLLGQHSNLSAEDSLDCNFLGSEKLLTIAINNVLDNVVKYSPEDENITFSCNSEGGKTVLRIADHGTGMPSEQLRTLFDEFYSLQPSIATDTTGLNLAISRQIMLLHGGDLSASSQTGKGTEFIFVFPVQPDDIS